MKHNNTHSVTDTH